MENYSNSSDPRTAILSEQNINTTLRMKENVNNQGDIKNIHEQNKYVDYNMYEQPENMNLIDPNNYRASLNNFRNGEINTPSINLYNGEGYMNSNNDLMSKPHGSLNLTSIPTNDLKYYEYVNGPINLNEEGYYYNKFSMNNNLSIPKNDNVINGMNDDMNNMMYNMNDNFNKPYLHINDEYIKKEMNNYKEINSLHNMYEYINNNNNVHLINPQYMMENYHSDLYHNLHNVPFNPQMYMNNFHNNENNNNNNVPLDIYHNESFPKNTHELDNREKKFSKLKQINMNKNNLPNMDQLQAIVCLQKLEEIPSPFLNISEIKYSVSAYFNSYDDIIEKYQSKFYNCKLNQSISSYADCDLQNEIISLPFNNEEFIYLKVIESSIYKTEVIGRLQLKVKSLSQEYPLRIPIIGDDGNSKGFLIMNFLITSSYYNLKNDILTDKSTLTNKTKSARLRRRNQGFHFFENFTKWCCEITDHNIN
ncbi:hypothetical protein C923_04475, partial [Plasmodium falciparum UGT5.1]|uniref:Uncharacterized protein n=10 Tax=Plasmodium falciparum TaxID=5833 RepID=Q8IEG2_PLAF7|eukprot:XP_001349889.1 conserved Plasmodium protein, unknown function [Plasmodium falciparum 3D7]